MKIGIIIPASMTISGSTSGVIRQAISYQNALINKGHDCKFINHLEGVYDFEYLLIFQHSPEINLLIDRIKIKNKKVKIVFLPIYDPHTNPNLIKKLIYRIPIEKLKIFSSPRLMRIGCDKSNSVWVRSKWEYRAIKATGTNTKIQIIPLAIPMIINDNLYNIKKDIDFIFVGHLDDPRKNVIRLIKAVSGISKELNIVGKCSKEKLKQIIKNGQKFKLKIIYHGCVSDDSLIKLYARSRVLCLPSLFEGVGLVALEASCYGANVVVTNIGGASDYFKEKAYYVNHPKDIKHIKNVLQNAKKESNDYSVINKEIVKKFSTDNIGSLIEKELKIK